MTHFSVFQLTVFTICDYFSIMAIYSPIFLFITAFIMMLAYPAYAQTVDIQSLFESVDESISGVIIKGRSTTITPKDVYNKVAAMHRERTRESQHKQKQRANARMLQMVNKQINQIIENPAEIFNMDTNKFTNMMSTRRNMDDPEVIYPLANEDVTHFHDFETRYVNGETMHYSEMYPDSAGMGGGKNRINRFASINLYSATKDITIIIPKKTKANDQPEMFITKEVTPKTKPANNVIGARAYG